MTPKFGYFRPEANFCFGILSTGHITNIPGDTPYPFGPPPTNFGFRYGSFSGAHPVFWAFRAITTSLVLVPFMWEMLSFFGPEKKTNRWHAKKSLPIPQGTVCSQRVGRTTVLLYSSRTIFALQGIARNRQEDQKYSWLLWRPSNTMDNLIWCFPLK